MSSVEPVEVEEVVVVVVVPDPLEVELEEGELPVTSWPPPAPPQLVIPTLAAPVPTQQTGTASCS